MLKPPASKLARRVFAQTFYLQQITPSGRCLWRFGSTCARLHMSGFAPLPPSLPSVSDAESQHPPVCWGMQLGTGRGEAGEAREKTTFGAGFPKWKLFSWELVLGREACATVCPEMGPDLLFFVTEPDQALVPLWMPYGTGDPVMYTAVSITGKGIPSQVPFPLFDYF